MTLARSLAVVLLVAPGVAGAAAPPPPSKTKQQADILFDAGQKLLASGAVDAACALFLQSEQLDPAPGALLNLAVCYEKAGRVASAFRAYGDAEALATERGQGDRALFARRKQADLGARVSYVHVVLPRSLRNPAVTVDGKALPPDAVQAPIALDAGAHTMIVTARRKKPLAIPIAIDEAGAVKELDVPVLENEEDDEPPPVAAAAVATAPVDAPPPVVEVDRKRAAGLVLAGAGAAALVAGAAFGAIALTRLGTAEGRDEAKLLGWAAAASAGVGVLAAGTGTFLIVTSGPKDAPRAALRIGPAGVSMSGVF